MLIFLMTSLLVGSGISLLKRFRPGFAPDLPIEVLKEDPREVHETDDSIHTSSRPKGAIPKADSQELDDLIRKTEELLQGNYPEIRININTASKQKLTLLPRIGPKTAEKIITYRKEKGPFKTKEEIMKVSGIGEKTYERMRKLITVE